MFSKKNFEYLSWICDHIKFIVYQNDIAQKYCQTIESKHHDIFRVLLNACYLIRDIVCPISVSRND